MFKAYIDESGIHDDSEVVTVAAYVGRASAWQEFTREWNKAKAPIRVFHASDCASRHGEFEGWEESDRNAYVANLLPVIARSKIQGFAVGVVLRDLRNALADNFALRMLLGTPYGFCFHVLMYKIARRKMDSGNAARIAFFHETNNFKKEAFDSFDAVKTRYGIEANLVSLTFGDKADFVPLQAADILAFETNKRLNTQGTPNRRAFDALDPSRITLDFLDKKTLPALLEWVAAHPPPKGSALLGSSSRNDLR